jgi:hypothetical protein
MYRKNVASFQIVGGKHKEKKIKCVSLRSVKKEDRVYRTVFCLFMERIKTFG